MARMVENLHLKVFFILIFLLIALISLVFLPLNLGLDLRGGSLLIYAIPEVEGEEASNIIDNTIDIFQKRIDTLGIGEIRIRPAGERDIQIELPGKDATEVKRIKEILESLGKLEWRLVLEGADLEKLGVNKEREDALRERLEKEGREYKGPSSPHVKWFPYQKQKGRGEYLSMKPEDFLSGEKDIKSVSQGSDRTGGRAVAFKIKPGSAYKMERLSEKNIGKKLAILFNDEIVSAPVLKTTISDEGIIESGMGGFEEEEQKELIVTIQSGSLEIKPELRNEETVGASIGDDAVRRGTIAIVIGGLSVFLFMGVYYLQAGLIANVSMVYNLLLLFGALKLLGGTLTLPGFAALILTVGMAVDANILIFERIREERGKGKTLDQAVKNGFERAFLTIIDSNVTTLITSVILYIMGTGPVRGFATVLSLGILTSLFSALVVSKVIIFYLLRRGVIKKMTMLRLIGEPRIPFITRYASPAILCSVLAILFGMICFFQRGEESYGLDFTGGTQTQIQLKDPMSPDAVRAMIDDIRVSSGEGAGLPKYTGIVVQSIQKGKKEKGSYTHFSIRAQVEEKRQPEFISDLKEAFKEKLVPPPITNTKKIPPSVEDETLKGFEEGWDLELHLENPVTESVLTQRLGEFTYEDQPLVEGMKVLGVGPSLSEEYKDYRVLLKLKRRLEPTALNAQLESLLRKEPDPLPLSEPIPLIRYIGKTVAGNLWVAATRAILFSLIAILIYIRIRFKEFKYGLGAVLALAHDVLIALGAVVAFDWFGLVEVKLDLLTIAAFLTIIGYSLNDTIVIFDRIRENLGRRESRGRPFKAVINHSINQTLSRTIFTAFTTLETVIVIFALNYGIKNDLEAFSFALIVGIIVGTYSTIFIASPFLLAIYRLLGGQSAEAVAEEVAQSKKRDKS